MKKTMAGFVGGGLALAIVLAGVGTASATLEMQKKTKEAGFKESVNCLYCHNEKLPKKGAVTNNGRGQWLADQKQKKGAKEIDVSWLKEYVEKK